MGNATTGFWADDGQCAVFFDRATSGEEAAAEYVEDGDWNFGDTTGFLAITTWQEDEDGERVNEGVHYVAVDPTEPDCEHADGHLWGESRVFGAGAGVIETRVCRRCGMEHGVKSGVNGPDGSQGWTVVSYEVAGYDWQSEVEIAREALEEAETLDQLRTAAEDYERACDALDEDELVYVGPDAEGDYTLLSVALGYVVERLIPEAGTAEQLADAISLVRDCCDAAGCGIANDLANDVVELAVKDGHADYTVAELVDVGGDPRAVTDDEEALRIDGEALIVSLDDLTTEVVLVAE